MDANLTCSPPVKNLTDGEQRSAFRGIFRGEKNRILLIAHIQRILQTKKAVKKPPLCSPRGNSLTCKALVINTHSLSKQQKYKQSKAIMNFSSLEYDTVQISIKYLQGLRVSV